MPRAWPPGPRCRSAGDSGVGVGLDTLLRQGGHASPRSAFSRLTRRSTGASPAAPPVRPRPASAEKASRRSARRASRAPARTDRRRRRRHRASWPNQAAAIGLPSAALGGVRRSVALALEPDGRSGGGLRLHRVRASRSPPGARAARSAIRRRHPLSPAQAGAVAQDCHKPLGDGAPILGADVAPPAEVASPPIRSARGGRLDLTFELDGRLRCARHRGERGQRSHPASAASTLRLSTVAVVRRLARDGDVVHVAFAQAGARDARKNRRFAACRDRCGCRCSPWPRAGRRPAGG